LWGFIKEPASSQTVVHSVSWSYIQSWFEWFVNTDGASISKIDLQWSTVQERTASLLSHYWRDYDTRDTYAKKYWYKTEFTVCLSQAETWLWYQKKSLHNYFNCWNNDRGYTIAHEWLYESFKSLHNSCLNGTYLSNKQTLSHLSPNHERSTYNVSYENECKYVYASSKQNWLNNMQNCLSNIHNKQIEPIYKFRR